MAQPHSQTLTSHKEEILALWAKRSIAEVPSASTGEALALRDSLPIYLDHLSEALANHRKLDFRSVFQHDQEGTRIGKMHGADRAANRSYVLTEVIFEYHILRECIFQVLESNGPLAAGPRDIIYDSIEQAVNDAAVEFSEVHADIQQKFINTLTHDLKNPITAAKMNAQIIAGRADTSPASLTSAKRVISGLNRLEAMIHDLLDASRIRAGERLSLQFEPCDLGTILQEVVDEMSIVHGDRFVMNCVGSEKGNWGADGIRRALENLIGNAVKYGTSKGTVTVALHRKPGSVELTVHNLGPAIPASEIPQLFQPYRRAKSALSGGKSGWGLGLTLVKGVADAHHGTIRTESSEAQGTTFFLNLPIAESNGVAEEALAKAKRDHFTQGNPTGSRR